MFLLDRAPRLIHSGSEMTSCEIFGTDIIGHATIVKLLSAWLKDPAPAYLFHGPAHLGKRTLSERFVKRLLGLEANDTRWQSHPDLVFLNPEEGKNLISVEQVRASRERLAMRPFVAPRIVAFLPHADRLNESGTNALLKIMEEPAAGAVFVMVAEDLGRIPLTVRSRSVMIPFNITPKKEIEESLVKLGMSRPEAVLRAESARGRPGFALMPKTTSDSSGRLFVERFLKAKSAGEKLYVIDLLVKDCESDQDPVARWRDELVQAMQATTKELLTNPATAYLLGTALIASLNTLSSAVPPRFPLEECVVNSSAIMG